MNRPRVLTCLLVLAAGAALGAATCRAQSEWVTPGFGLWSDSINWSDGVPNGDGDIAIFGAFTGIELEVAIELAPVTVGELQFLGPGFVAIGGTRDLVLAAGPQFEFPSIFVDGAAPDPFIFTTLAGTQGLEKLGTGAIFLEGALDYFGPTIITEGNLILGSESQLQNGSVIVREGAAWDVTSHASYSLASGQVLSGGGIVNVNELRVTNDSVVSPGDPTFSGNPLGALSINGSLLLDFAAPVSTGGLQFDLSADPLSGTEGNDAIDVTGDVDVVGLHQIYITPIDNQLTPGNYPLLTYGGALDLTGGTLQVVHNTRYNIAVDSTTPGEVVLDVSGSKADLVWQGGINSDWDIGATANWLGGGGLFFDLDCVQFDDTATRFNVDVVQDVRPGAVVIDNNEQDYQFFGPGAIRGAAPLTKRGVGRATFFNRAEFSTIDVQDGTLAVGFGGEVVAAVATDVRIGANFQLDDGTLQTPNLSIHGGGELTGNGLIKGKVVVGDGTPGGAAAVLSPGFSPGTIEIDGDLDLESDAETLIEVSGLAGNPHDMIIVSGNATLNGLLRIDAIDGYAPQAGDEFTVLTSGERVEDSEFEDVEAARVGDIILWPSYVGDDLMLVGQLIGDMDLSGEVDEDDIPQFAFALRDNEAYDDALFATEFEVADVDGNGRVDFGDISPFADKVGENSDATPEAIAAIILASLAVPEPTTCWLLLTAVVAIPARRRRASKVVPSRSGFTLIELLVVITIISVLIGLLLPAIQAARDAARRTACSNHCRQLALAVHAYEGQHAEFPAGARAHRQPNIVSVGWQVLVLPNLEQHALYDQIAPDSDGGAGPNGHNMSVHAVPMFHCPSADGPFTDLETENGSNYAGVAGAGKPEYRLDLEDASCGDLFTDGVLTYDKPNKTSDLTDGSSHTLLLGERTYWLLEGWTFGAKWRGDPPDRICVESIKNLRYPLNANLERVGYYVRDFSVPADKRAMVRNDLLFGSHHPGGVYFTFADSSVHFLNEEIDFTVLQDTATRNGGETIP